MLLPVANTAIRKAADAPRATQVVDATGGLEHFGRPRRAGRSLAILRPGGAPPTLTRGWYGPLSEFSCPVRVTQVSSLWTPGGEHPVDPESTTAPGGLPEVEAEPDPEAEAEIRAELDEVRRQLAQVPPEVVVANHAMGL